MGSEAAGEVAGVRDAVASAVTTTFLENHPDWIERYGERAQKRGVEDARHHIDFLRAAVDLEDPGVFADYVLWCRDVLGSRGMAVSFLVENLEAIRDELEVRLPPPAAQAMIAAVHTGLRALDASEGSPDARGDSLSSACRLYLAASVSGRRAHALDVVRGALRAGDSPLDVYIDIFQEALYEVGRRWQDTSLSVAEEHMATATTQFILSVLQEEFVRSGTARGTAVVTGVAGELHVVGASIIANALEADGWDVRFLGTNLPDVGIFSAIDQCGASLVCISVTMSGCVQGARDLIAGIRQSSAAQPRILVGGTAFRRDPQLWRTIGADGFASDVRGAHELALAGT